MLNAYERQLILFYLSNAAAHFHHSVRGRREELAEWVTENRDLLALSDETEEPGEHQASRPYEKELSTQEWKHLRKTLEEYAAACNGGGKDRTARRLCRLGQEMDLAPEDIAFLEIVLCNATQPIFVSLIDCFESDHRYRQRFFNVTHPVLPCILGIPASAFRARFTADAPLVKLSTGKPGVNILVYGPPGTGKTEFCKTLAARLGANLYTVGEEDERCDPKRHERLQELRLSQRLLASVRGSILLFDEMEDLLSDPGSGWMPFSSHGFPHLRASGSKMFLNRLLERTPAPTLWTSNSARQTCPAVLRLRAAPATVPSPGAYLETRTGPSRYQGDRTRRTLPSQRVQRDAGGCLWGHRRGGPLRRRSHRSAPRRPQPVPSNFRQKAPRKSGAARSIRPRPNPGRHQPDPIRGFKIALDYLTPDQSQAAFRTYFALNPPPELGDLTILTPGDFAVVRRKAEILGHLQDTKALAELLRAECEAKPNHSRKMGF